MHKRSIYGWLALSHRTTFAHSLENRHWRSLAHQPLRPASTSSSTRYREVDIILLIIKKYRVSWRCANLRSLNTIFYDWQTAMSSTCSFFTIRSFNVLLIEMKNASRIKNKLNHSKNSKMNYRQRFALWTFADEMSKKLHTYIII